MENVGPGPRNGVNPSSGGFAVLRGIIAVQNRKFLNGVHAEVSAQDAAGSSVGVIIETDTVEPIIVLLRPSARNAQLLTEAAIATICTGRESRLGLNGVNTRLEGCQVRPTPTVK